MKQRIWELDVFRGICILGMVIVHLLFDLSSLLGWTYPPAFFLIKQWGGVLFLLLSGICVTLGRHNLRRGMVVLCCGLLCTAATAALYLLELAGSDILIWFGVLHCLGICMLLWSLFSKLPLWGLGVCGAAMVIAGLFLNESVQCPVLWLVPLGIPFPGFVTSDYFPLLPNLGFFLLGALLGRTLYRQGKSLFPGVAPDTPIVGLTGFCGRHSLAIYLLHQPLIVAVIWLTRYFHS